jgi:hypothetical protein
MTERMSAAEFQAQPKRKSKYGNQPVTIDGVRFDSRREADRWCVLRLREKAGEISHLELQPKFYFIIKGEHVKYPSGRKAFYKADFSYFEGNHRVVEDAKGFKTDVYKLKKALIEKMYPAVRIIET